MLDGHCWVCQDRFAVVALLLLVWISVMQRIVTEQFAQSIPVLEIAETVQSLLLLFASSVQKHSGVLWRLCIANPIGIVVYLFRFHIMDCRTTDIYISVNICKSIAFAIRIAWPFFPHLITRKVWATLTAHLRSTDKHMWSDREHGELDSPIIYSRCRCRLSPSPPSLPSSVTYPKVARLYHPPPFQLDLSREKGSQRLDFIAIIVLHFSLPPLY